MAKFVLDFNLTFDFELIGICSHAKEYKLCWALNKNLDLGMEKVRAGFEDVTKSGSTRFNWYRVDEEEQRRVVHLIQNKSPGKVLISSLRHIDYFLLIYDWSESENVVKKLRSIPEVLTAVSIDPYSEPELEKLIYE